MLYTVGDIMNEFLARAYSSTTVGFFSDARVKDWIQQGHQMAAAYKKWPHTQGRLSTTYASVEEWVFEGYRPDAFRIVQVGGKRLQKVNYEDYLNYKEDQPSGQEKIFSSYGGTMFINTAADISGTLTVFGQFVPSLDITDLTATTIFSASSPDANEAIVEYMMFVAKSREKKFRQEALGHRQLAESILDRAWKNYEDEQFANQTKDRSMFKRFDILSGRGIDDLNRRDQF